MNILITYALPAEKVGVSLEGCTVRYCETGVGKVNAALNACMATQNFAPDLILNIGTAGSVSHPVDSIVLCSRFIDRDMDKLKEFGVDFEHDFSATVAHIPWLKSFDIHNTCNTGDSFVTQAIDNADVVDMETFAVAALCKKLNIPFVSVKYITDTIGANSVKHWEEKLQDANTGLQEFFNQLSRVKEDVSTNS